MATIELDANDPMDRAFLRMIEMNQKKRADYAGSDPFSNFRKVAAMMQLEGYDHIEDCMTMVCRKIARINNLRGRSPKNEAVIDSYEDLAVYATLLFAMVLQHASTGTTSETVVYQEIPTLRQEFRFEEKRTDL
jgi:hypothetical protein